MKIIISSIIIVFFISCAQNNGNNKKVENSSIVASEGINKVDLKKSLLTENIDVQKVKSQLDGVTTTFLSKEDIIFFPKKKESKFFGHYTLIKNDSNGSPSKIVGEMVIYDSVNPYVYEKKTDEFIEITLIDKGVLLYNGKLEVGISMESLIEELGDKYETKNNTLIFNENNKIAFFEIKSNLVSKIKIGVYLENVDVEKILKHSNW